MGEKIQKAFNKIMEVSDLGVRMAISMKAGIPSANAKTIIDDHKNLTLMKQAVDTVFNDLSNNTIKSKKNEVLAMLQ